MVWVLNAVDTGVTENDPPQVGAARSLIAEALKAINAGEQCTAVNDEYEIAAMAVYVGERPACIRMGYVVPVREELVSLMQDCGAQDASVRQIHWIYDIPIKQE